MITIVSRRYPVSVFSAIFVTLSSKLSIFDRKPRLKALPIHPKIL